MGYESKVYIVEKGHIGMTKESDKHYSNVIAMFDVCKFPSLSDYMRAKPETNCYFYADDGDTRVTEDRYGKPLTEASVDEVITVLEAIIGKGEKYRRIFPLLATLRNIAAFQRDGMWEEVAVLHYGY